MPKSHWKGFISFGLVSIPINLFPMENKSADITFHQIDKSDHARIQYQRVNSNTGKKVKWEDIIKGYEYDAETIIPLPDKILKNIAGEKAHELAIEEFIAQSDLDMLTVDRSYYVTPGKNGDKGYVILREALEVTAKIGIGKIIISTKEYIGAISPYQNKALVLSLLKYDEEVNKINDYEIPNKEITKYKVTKKEIDIAKKLISSMTSKWRPEKYINEYQTVLHNWVDEEINNKPHKKSQTKKKERTSNIVDFTELLKKSLNKHATHSTKKSSKKITPKSHKKKRA